MPRRGWYEDRDFGGLGYLWDVSKVFPAYQENNEKTKEWCGGSMTNASRSVKKPL